MDKEVEKHQITDVDPRQVMQELRLAYIVERHPDRLTSFDPQPEALARAYSKPNPWPVGAGAVLLLLDVLGQIYQQLKIANERLANIDEQLDGEITIPGDEGPTS